jgi:31-O-methyltransferase
MGIVTARLANGLELAQVNQYETNYLYEEIFTGRQYLPASLPDLPREPVVFDIGANIGMFSLFAAQTWPGARIEAFEPVPEVFAALEHNVAPIPNAWAHRVALGRFPGTTTMSYFPGFTMMSGLRADPEHDMSVARDYLVRAAGGRGAETGGQVLGEAAAELLAARFEPTTVSCAVRTLTEVFEESGTARIDLLKIDVERYEFDVLLGIEDRTWPSIHRIAVEVEDLDGELDEVTDLLSGQGMTCVALQADDYRGSSLYMVHALR